MTPIYLDHNATTPVLPAVWEAMQPFLREHFGNPASSHQFGRRARQALEDARERAAALLGADPDEVIFTSGATEANNLALFGLAGEAPGQLLASPLEHPCVIEPLRQLEQCGFTLRWLPVDDRGVVKVADTEPVLDPPPRLAAVMLANHETGAVQPVAEIARRVPVHCDAAAAAGKIPIHFHDLGVASLTVSAHKFHGPKGAGALLLRRGIKAKPLVFGGHQQQGRRPGTEPVALAAGLATALDLAMREGKQRTARVLLLRNRFLAELEKGGAAPMMNGPESSGIPHTLNLSFSGCRADVLLMNLDLAGVACSTGSACSSGSLLPSPVLQAMGVTGDRLLSAMRFSFSPFQEEAEIVEAAHRVAAVVQRLRQSAPEAQAPEQIAVADASGSDWRAGSS